MMMMMMNRSSSCGDSHGHRSALVADAADDSSTGPSELPLFYEWHSLEIMIDTMECWR